MKTMLPSNITPFLARSHMVGFRVAPVIIYLWMMLNFMFTPHTAAQETSTDQAINRHLRSEFGPYPTVEKAKGTLQRAMSALTTQCGGVLVIPNDDPERFFPENTSQSAYNAPARAKIDWQMIR